MNQPDALVIECTDVKTLREAGFELLKKGITTIEEVASTTTED